MKQLTEYTKNNYIFKVVRREGKYGIFKGLSKGGTLEVWEVIEIQSHDGNLIDERYYEPSEYPPRNEQWGHKGWTCTSLENATTRFLLLTHDK